MDLYAGFDVSTIPIQALNDSLLADNGVKLSILRTDLIHPELSGNKWFKLKYNLIRAREEGKSVILSFGGAWSNHLHALAHAGRLYGFETIGIVRGERQHALTPCLEDAAKAGMKLEFITRESYRHKHTPAFLSDLNDRFKDFYLIPEGGANREGRRGCSEIPSLYEQQDFDLVCMASGTGTTLAGMAASSLIPLTGFQVMKGRGYLAALVDSHLEESGAGTRSTWSINEDYHFGGFAKATPPLMQFIQNFENKHEILLEPVYSGKALFGIYELAKKRDIFPHNCSILLIHGGGLQGRRGYI